jgi:membrane protein YqaA with SNARE-associated domain
MDELGDFGLWGMVVIISVLGVLAKLVYYKIGDGGREAIMDHIPKLEPERLEEIEDRYEHSGSRLLLLSSIPGLGSAIAASAGLFHTPMLTFVVLVFISNLVRNWFVIYILDQGAQFLSSE